MECKRCLFTSEFAEIGDKQCNYCDLHDKLESSVQIGYLETMIRKIKKAGRDKQYDCLIGISGGLDSSTMLYMAVKKWGLRPLVIHFDNWWNAPEATYNMNALLRTLNVNSITYKVDKAEFDRLNHAFLAAGVPDADIPNDIAMTKLMYQTADFYNIKYILNGHDFRTEGSTPAKWTYMDAKYIRSIYRKFTNEELRNYPLFTFKDQIIYGLKGIKQERPFYYVSFRERYEAEMKQLIGWKDYGGKHCENVYTEFVGSYLLPEKFKIDKTIVYLSAQVRSGKISKEAAIERLKLKTPFKTEKLGVHRKLILHMAHTSDITSRTEFDRYNFRKYKALIWLLAKLKVVPYTFYVKYAK